eukprot:9545159-Prorocentrum_lima.AAC.1
MLAFIGTLLLLLELRLAWLAPQSSCCQPLRCCETLWYSEAGCAMHLAWTIGLACWLSSWLALLLALQLAETFTTTASTTATDDKYAVATAPSPGMPKLTVQ